MTNGPGEPYRYPEHLLQFPSNEQDHTRQLDIRFSYSHPSARAVVEEIHLYTTDRTARLSSQFWVSAYAETGYEGHGGKQIEATDESMLEFLELVARIVGDDPESYTEWYERKLVDLLRIYEGTQEGKKMNELSELLWPAQALYESVPARSLQRRRLRRRFAVTRCSGQWRSHFSMSRSTTGMNFERNMRQTDSMASG